MSPLSIPAFEAAGAQGGLPRAFYHEDIERTLRKVAHSGCAISESPDG